MRVAITGISGSLGQALLSRLARDGADRIVGFSRVEQVRLELQAKYAWHPGVKIYGISLGLADTQRLTDAFSQCECVIHCAARKVVSGHYDEPREMHLTNVVGTLNVLVAARQAGVRKLLFISSDKAVHPCNVYGASKMLAEQLVISENARCFAQGLRCSVSRSVTVLALTGAGVGLGW